MRKRPLESIRDDLSAIFEAIGGLLSGSGAEAPMSDRLLSN